MRFEIEIDHVSADTLRAAAGLADEPIESLIAALVARGIAELEEAPVEQIFYVIGTHRTLQDFGYDVNVFIDDAEETPSRASETA